VWFPGAAVAGGDEERCELKLWHYSTERVFWEFRRVYVGAFKPRGKHFDLSAEIRHHIDEWRAIFVVSYG